MQRSVYFLESSRDSCSVFLSSLRASFPALLPHSLIHKQKDLCPISKSSLGQAEVSIQRGLQKLHCIDGNPAYNLTFKRIKEYNSQKLF